MKGGGFIEEKAMITTRIHPLNAFRTVPPPSKPLLRKRVSFEADATAIPHCCGRSNEDIKTCWYSKRELAIGCREAKQTIALIQSVNGNWNSIDHSRICIIGLEKFHGKKERDANKKLLIKSVLIRQEMNKNLGLIQEKTNGLKEISTMISASFKEYARWQAAMHMVHAYGSQPSSCAPPPPPSTQLSSVNCNDKRLRIDLTTAQTTKNHQPTMAPPMNNNTPKPLIQTLEGCTNTTNTKRIKRYHR
ncbi:unnamed protein product [Cylindrotheca closterium]|uniref:Uncharacterized protein n=1 Tax=Cylindrotheca closterium TaxID=2856 RepID=A0AAD2CAH0_9STRA|nr:unnamed protein product [Cylindrotheca closterium]